MANEREFKVSAGEWGAASGLELPPYRRILVVVDGSSAAEAAVHTAAAIARRSGATLHVAGVAAPNRGVPGALGRLDVVSLVTRGWSAAMAAYLERLNDRVRTRWHCELGGPLLIHGPPSEVPVALIRHVCADLLLCAARQAGSLSREVLACSPVALTRRTGVPVMMVPGTLDRTVWNSRVVVLLDAATDPRRRILHEARRFASLWDASVTTARLSAQVPLAATGTDGGHREVRSVPGGVPPSQDQGTSSVLVIGDQDPGALPWVRWIAEGSRRRRESLLVCPTS